jgi:hypothetical protein
MCSDRDAEAERFDARFQVVTCAACGASYRCTPTSDYYNNTTNSDGVCEACLLTGARGANPPDPDPLKSPLIKELIAAGRARVNENGTVTVGAEAVVRADPLSPKEFPDA